MNECKALHETKFAEIINKIKSELSNIKQKVDGNKKEFNSSSIAKLTSNLVLVFPVMVSRNISISSASLITKAIERKAIQMVQMIFSAYQLTDEENINNLVDYISRFHSNIKLGSKITVDDVIDVLNAYSEAHHIKPNIDEIKAIKEDMRNTNFYFEEDLNPISLADYTITKNYLGKTVVTEAASVPHNRPLDMSYDTSRKNNQSDGYKDLKTRSDVLKAQLLDQEVKKDNELTPSIIHVNFMHTTQSGQPVMVKGGILGIKARMIPIDSEDIITHLLIKAEDSNWLTNFFRASTREISFFRDLIFAIDNAKMEALSRSKQGSSSPMWKVLERRAIKSRINRNSNNNNDAMAITTLCVSQEEIEYIKKEKNLDFESFNLAKVILNKYNFLCFCIVDEGLEVAKFLFDTGEAMWENYAFSSLEKQSKNDDYKKIINLMTKVSR